MSGLLCQRTSLETAVVWKITYVYTKGLFKYQLTLFLRFLDPPPCQGYHNLAKPTHPPVSQPTPKNFWSAKNHHPPPSQKIFWKCKIPNTPVIKNFFWNRMFWNNLSKNFNVKVFDLFIFAEKELILNDISLHIQLFPFSWLELCSFLYFFSFFW